MTGIEESPLQDSSPDTPVSTGFPQGYFLIRNVGTGRFLDIEMNQSHDGAEAILFPQTEKSHVLPFRSVGSDNQVFFVDYSGVLCCKSNGHGLDVDNEGRIVVRHRRPVTQPFPNRYSHPHPQFHYFPKTSQISVEFSYDPAYPGPNQLERSSWRNRSYILTSIPAQQPRGLLDDMADFAQGAASVISAPFTSVLGLGGEPAATPSNANDVGEFDLRPEELSEVDRADHEGIDDATDPIRRVRVISLVDNVNRNVGPRTMQRRQWEIIPLLRTKAMTGAI